jgi:hypothetical protein
MAVVQGVREKVHLPIYDSLTIRGGQQLREVEASSTLKFFVNVQGKTKLETNLQSASLLPHYNTFEARALRVVISDLPPDFGDDEFNWVASGDDGVTLEFTASLTELIDHLRADEDLFDVGGVSVTRDQIEEALDSFDKKAPIDVQVEDDDTTGIINRLIYNTVTTLYVGEKTMIQMPTWFFPAGAGAYSESGSGATHGVPSPSDTFRFAEPIFIEKQQNFRVEIEVPDSETLKDLHRIYGPMYIWVVLDGYMTRSVQ